MFMAIAVETMKHPQNRSDYKVWHLELNKFGDVIGVGVMTREELVKNLFENYRKNGRSNWKAFLKGAEKSVPIEIYDFISQNMNENTHFGNLPTLSEFQGVLDNLQLNLEVKAIA